MRTIFHGFSSWARFQHSTDESIQMVDAAITIVATLLVALAWAMVKHTL